MIRNRMIEGGETGCKLDLRWHEGGPLEGCLMFSTTPDCRSQQAGGDSESGGGLPGVGMKMKGGFL